MATKPTPKETKFVFKIDDDWTPSKLYVMDDFAKDLITAVQNLKPGQNVPIPVMELKRRYHWEIKPTIAQAVRAVVQKGVSVDYFSKLSVHVQKNADGVITHVRVRRHPESE